MEQQQEQHEGTLHRLHREHRERIARFNRAGAVLHVIKQLPTPSRQQYSTIYPFQEPPHWLKPISFRGTVTGRPLVVVLARYFGLTLADVCSVRKVKRLSDARCFICYVLFVHKKWTLSRIGRAINRDHSTVFHSVQNIMQAQHQDDAIKRKIAELVCMCRQATF